MNRRRGVVSNPPFAVSFSITLMADAAGASSTKLRITPIQWVICVVAAIGFAFDIYALLVLPLIVRPALMELGRLKPGTPDFNRWVGLLFYVPAMAGGIFGMIGGYLTDLFGRRRILVWSILLYAFSAAAAAYATSLRSEERRVGKECRSRRSAY